ncbi:signal peptide peptidase SppA [Halopolyspora algeriensis]|uniref:Signal peptide peptidase SppA n=1 Tax=Halopolyspora algeriensis TaxID=1500506 RepID=A0A368VZF1_9ACTN|nr:S49 family peptidase [Halopolyspora algeriensis]RCW47285.1 signal peptide peptidase SppA [Halopolyspora algeriensis]TQM42520.1 signal peptide peptidase SppA [Halopolyspora algeriensis]
MNERVPHKLTSVLSEKLSSRLPAKLAERAERGPVVPVVRLHGVITPTPSPVNRSSISLHTVESALTRAFSHDRTSAVALSINSPGGAATQSALVAERIRELAESKNVPVLTFCEDLAASGGYWLACAGDEVYAHSTSMVGSVGVVSAGFGLEGLLDRVGVERRIHTAGNRKVRLDPFRPEKEEDVEWLQSLQTEMHEQFAEWIRTRRGDKLDASGDELFSGEVWSGARAKELGLVDGTGTLREIVRERFPDAHVVQVEPRKPLLARLGVSGPGSRSGGTGIAAAAAGSMLAAVDELEQRALWSRFGL